MKEDTGRRPIWIDITEQEQEFIENCMELRELADRITEMGVAILLAQETGIIERANEDHGLDDNIKIDEHPSVSIPADGSGYWVSAWVWVNDEGEDLAKHLGVGKQETPQ